jgi:hypothetical protein
MEEEEEEEKEEEEEEAAHWCRVCVCVSRSVPKLASIKFTLKIIHFLFVDICTLFDRLPQSST